MQNISTDAFLARLACERARVISPFVLITQVGSFAVSEPLGIALTAPVISFNIISITLMAVLTLLLRRRRVPLRWAHHALAMVWWCPVGGTVISQSANGNHVLVLLVLVEIACIAVLLELRAAVASLVVLGVLYVPLVMRDAGLDTSVYLAALGTGAAFAMLMLVLMRRALVSAEVHRVAEAETATVLAQQLAQLETSEADRRQLQDQLVHAQRMEAIGTLAAGVAHDMNNALAAVTNYASLLLEDVPEPARDDVRQIIAQTTRAAELTRGLLAFSRRGQYRKQVVTFDDVLRDVVPLLERTLPKYITLSIELGGGDARVDGDRVQLGQTIINFAINASSAIEGSGTLTIRSDRVTLDTATAALHGLAAGRFVRVRVTDTGSGMDEATRRRVFEPFFTTKPMGKGTGLGLSVVWGILQAHDGAVGVESQLGEGSTFWILVPETSRDAQHTPIALASDAPTTATILVVDDDQAVREGSKRLLQRKGYRVLCADNGLNALQVFDANHAAIHLVILDMGMPVMGGAECFDQLRTRSQVPVLVATGYASDGEAQALTQRGASLIEKPYATEDLLREVGKLVCCATHLTDN